MTPTTFSNNFRHGMIQLPFANPIKLGPEKISGKWVIYRVYEIAVTREVVTVSYTTRHRQSDLMFPVAIPPAMDSESVNSNSAIKLLVIANVEVRQECNIPGLISLLYIFEGFIFQHGVRGYCKIDFALFGCDADTRTSQNPCCVAAQIIYSLTLHRHCKKM